MDQQLIGPLLLLAGTLVGAVATWFLIQQQSKDATNKATAKASTEIALLTQRLSATEAESSAVKQTAAERQTAISELNGKIALLASDVAQMTERANRVPQLESSLEERSAELKQVREEIVTVSTKLAERQEIIEGLRNSETQLRAEIESARIRAKVLDESLSETRAEYARQSEELKREKEASAEKIALLRSAGEELRNEFKVLANEIFKESAKDFSTKQKEALSEILTPFKTKLEDFEKNVKESGIERAVLKEQVGELVRLNTQLSTEASNLTKALKGQSKVRGNWGEIILKRTFEIAGLREGIEYSLQESFAADSGARLQPDAVIRLPQNRSLVVDAKVSLNSYDEYVAAETEESAAAARRGFVESVRTHMRGLSDKRYHALSGLAGSSPDFVLMFMPIEPAFHLAVSQDTQLWEEGWGRNVLLVGPSTLLFVLRTVAYLWQQERQNQNVQEIARLGGIIHDKLVAFMSDMSDIGIRLEQAQASHGDALKKLSGRGSAIRQALRLGTLGAKTSKSFSPQLVAEMQAESDDMEALDTSTSSKDDEVP